jgi:hypothetical protein
MGWQSNGCRGQRLLYIMRVEMCIMCIIIMANTDYCNYSTRIY